MREELPQVPRCDRDEFSAADVSRLLEDYRSYLLSIANHDLPATLRPKISASDIVQNTVVNAWQGFPRFAGRSRRELAGWLRQILRHSLIDARRTFQVSRKRQIEREVRLDRLPLRARVSGDLVSRENSPSTCASSRELTRRVEEALGHLNDSRRTVVLLHNRDGLSFPDIALRIGRSAEAARKLWVGAIEQLQRVLERPHDARRRGISSGDRHDGL
jgi:RNA polymerase sigma-70 factor (ECF subfamily)